MKKKSGIMKNNGDGARSGVAAKIIMAKIINISSSWRWQLALAHSLRHACHAQPG